MLDCSAGAAAAELQLCMTLNPLLQRLNIGVFEGRNLQDASRNEGVYVKVVLLQVRPTQFLGGIHMWVLK